MTIPQIPLGDGVSIPQLGFGLWQVADEQMPEAVQTALAAGYRHFDDARIYDNEAAFGKALAASGVPRSEVFVTTKVWNDDAQSREGVLAAFDASLSRLGLDYLDLYLIHWPVPKADRYVEAWRTMLELKETGRVRAVGVCNFLPEHIERLVAETEVAPCINQIELHPHLQQVAARKQHERLGIVTEAWSPLKQGVDVLTEPVIEELAHRYAVTPGQVVLRWHVQLGNVVIPKSVTPERIRANFDIFDVELSAEDMAAIAALDRGERKGPDPARFHADVQD